MEIPFTLKEIPHMPELDLQKKVPHPIAHMEPILTDLEVLGVCCSEKIIRRK